MTRHRIFTIAAAIRAMRSHISFTVYQRKAFCSLVATSMRARRTLASAPARTNRRPSSRPAALTHIAVSQRARRTTQSSSASRRRQRADGERSITSAATRKSYAVARARAAAAASCRDWSAETRFATAR